MIGVKNVSLDKDDDLPMLQLIMSNLHEVTERLSTIAFATHEHLERLYPNDESLPDINPENISENMLDSLQHYVVMLEKYAAISQINLSHLRRLI